MMYRIELASTIGRGWTGVDVKAASEFEARAAFAEFLKTRSIVGAAFALVRYEIVTTGDGEAVGETLKAG